MSDRVRVLELFCGIGGCAAAIGAHADVVGAIDISTQALAVYGHNFDHPRIAATIESVSADRLCRFDADLWWMSPPCQPFTRRGKRRDVDDPRCAPLLALIERIPHVRPRWIALENVPGFRDSVARRRLRDVLTLCGYAADECLLCPTELGIPNRRRRYYLVASRDDLIAPLRAAPAAAPRKTLAEFLEHAPAGDLYLSDEVARQYADAIDLVDAADPGAVCSCFTSAYGRSHVRSGSYLRAADGVRRFCSREILRLLGFPAGYELPPGLSRRAAWKLVGASLSVPAVQTVLTAMGAFASMSGAAQQISIAAARPGGD